MRELINLDKKNFYLDLTATRYLKSLGRSVDSLYSVVLTFTSLWCRDQTASSFCSFGLAVLSIHGLSFARVLHALSIMAFSDGTTVNGHSKPNSAQTSSCMNSSQNCADAKAANSNGHPDNRFVPSEAASANGGQTMEERERRVSSSSSSDCATSQLRRRQNKKGKKKSNRKNLVETPASPAPAAVSQEAQDAGCAGCSSDLTDSDVEVCNVCFGLKKRTENMDEEFCPFPFSFIEKKYLPLWMHEPEYMMAPKAKTKTEDKEHRIDVHKNRDSLFSTSSGFTNYRGLLNLALILLVLSSTRLFIENLMKYGVLIEPLETAKKCFGNLNNWPNVKIIVWHSLHPLTSFCLEYFLSKGLVSEKVGVLGHSLNGLVQLTYPAIVVLREHPSPVFSALTLGIVTVTFLKLISYAHTNYWCRMHKQEHRSIANRRRRQSTSGDRSNQKGSDDAANGIVFNAPIVEYPNNINLKDMLYFLLAPTLCYELNFPRSARIRKRFLIKRIVEMVFLLMVIIGLVQQWIVPTINNAIKPLSELDFFKCIERLLKLSIPNHFIWLMFFYTFFHSMLNVLAELLMFGDRDFYQDWWNAETVSEFWQNWNIPVHQWATRHLYKPMRKRGVGKMVASIAVFMVSAFFHEYLVSTPLRMFKVWAFLGMLGQVPLAYFTAKYMSGKWGNIVVWLSLILGQPMAILAYVHDYYVMSVVSHPLTNSTVTASLPRTEL